MAGDGQTFREKIAGFDTKKQLEKSPGVLHLSMWKVANDMANFFATNANLGQTCSLQNY